MVKEVKTASDMPSIGNVLILGYLDWCKSCMQFVNDFEKLEEVYPSTIFLKEKTEVVFEHSHQEGATEFPYVISKKDGVEKIFYNMNTRRVTKLLRTN